MWAEQEYLSFKVSSCICKADFSATLPVHRRCTYTHSKTGYVISGASARLEGQTSVKLWDWQGKESSTAIITHTHTVMKYVDGYPLTKAVWTLLVCLTLFLSLFLYTHMCSERKIHLFFINKSQCQVATLNPVLWVKEKCLFVSRDCIHSVILPPGILLNGIS